MTWLGAVLTPLNGQLWCFQQCVTNFFLI